MPRSAVDSQGASVSGRRRQQKKRRRRPRNRGYGRDVQFAARNALRASNGDKRFATNAAHRRRFAAIWNEFCNPMGWRTFEDATSDGICIVAEQLREAVTRGRYKISYAHNLISSLNVVLRAAIGPSAPRVSAVWYLGPRTQVRTVPPGGASHEVVFGVVSALRAEELHQAAAVVLLARGLGLRLREALLANIPRLLREARAHGRVNIQDGTKGGRTAPRWVPVNAMGLEALEAAAKVAKGRNILGAGDTVIGTIRGPIRRARKILHAHGVRKFHDLRAAYGCERYEQITGLAAPVLGGSRPAREILQEARKQVAMELGHSRAQIASAYIGGWARK